MIKAGFGIDLNEQYWIDNKEYVIPALGLSPRQLMQTLGTEWGRNIVGSNTWITLAKQRLLAIGPGMVVPDVRFENEADWVRSVGGLIVHIKRSAVAVSKHESENGVAQQPGDAILNNIGTLDDLKIAVRDLLHLP